MFVKTYPFSQPFKMQLATRNLQLGSRPGLCRPVTVAAPVSSPVTYLTQQSRSVHSTRPVYTAAIAVVVLYLMAPSIRPRYAFITSTLNEFLLHFE